MLRSTPDEKQAIIDYMNWQAPDLTVEFLQKVHAENVLSHQHVVWDVHTNVDRWWVFALASIIKKNTFPSLLQCKNQIADLCGDTLAEFHRGSWSWPCGYPFACRSGRSRHDGRVVDWNGAELLRT
jgi:hypothetical protein